MIVLQVVEPFTAHYVFALGIARFLSCAHWILQVDLLSLLEVSSSIHFLCSPTDARPCLALRCWTEAVLCSMHWGMDYGREWCFFQKLYRQLSWLIFATTTSKGTSLQGVTFLYFLTLFVARTNIMYSIMVMNWDLLKI